MTKHLSIDIAVPFDTSREAKIAYGSLSVDAEPRRGGVKKCMKLKENILNVHFEAQEAKSLRVGVNSFFDHLGLVVKTIQQFGPPKTETHIGEGDHLS